MPIYTKFKATHRRKKLRAGFLWLLVIAGLGLLGWILWQAGKPTEKQRATKGEGSGPAKIAKLPEKLSFADLTNFSSVMPPVPGARTNSLPVPLAITSTPSQVSATQSLVPLLESEFAPGPVQNVLEAQVAMALLGISAGSLDSPAWTSRVRARGPDRHWDGSRNSRD